MDSLEKTVFKYLPQFYSFCPVCGNVVVITNLSLSKELSSYTFRGEQFVVGITLNIDTLCDHCQTTQHLIVPHRRIND